MHLFLFLTLQKQIKCTTKKNSFHKNRSKADFSFFLFHCPFVCGFSEKLCDSMPINEWWNVYFDKWNEYQSIHSAINQHGDDCKDNENCLSFNKTSFMLHLYQSWNKHHENLKIKFLSNRIKQRSNNNGVWLYYLHRAYIYAELNKFDQAIKDVFDGCIANDTNNDTVMIFPITHNSLFIFIFTYLYTQRHGFFMQYYYVTQMKLMLLPNFYKMVLPNALVLILLQFCHKSLKISNVCHYQI